MGKAVLRTGAKGRGKSSTKKLSKATKNVIKNEVAVAYDSARERQLRMLVHYGNITQEEADELRKKKPKKSISPARKRRFAEANEMRQFGKKQIKRERKYMKDWYKKS